MTAFASTMHHRQLRAPQQDRGWLIEPACETAAALVEENRTRLQAADYDLQGRRLNELRDEARRQLLAAAVEYSRRYRDIALPAEDAPLLLSGHQPELFHPGVWFKNFALGVQAERIGAAGVHLLVDNDTCKSAALRVPGGSVQEPLAQSVPFDAPSPQMPYEERPIYDRELLASLVQRATAAMLPLQEPPLLESFWPRVVQLAEQFPTLGGTLSAARHQLEGEWGLKTLELPLSQVCQLEPFHWLTAHLLAQLPRLWEVHNAAVSEYRRVHRLRSANHPFPMLASEDDWLEAPYWVWSNENPQRRRLFVRSQGDQLLLSDHAGWEQLLPLSPEGEATAAVEVLSQLACQGIKLRTRAVTTTLASRLLFSDLFLHGIGGAKYDQVTDTIIEQFFGLQPPAFQVATATLRLPIARAEFDSAELPQVDRKLRDLDWNPDRHVSQNGNPELGRLIAEKQSWIKQSDPPRPNERFSSIRRINAALQPYVADQREQLQAQRQELRRRNRAERILASREYAFPLYPQSALHLDQLIDG